jgi:hypothetical protein
MGATASNGLEQREIELLRSNNGECRETIRDLRTRLDLEAEERRRMTEERRQLLGIGRPACPWWR